VGSLGRLREGRNAPGLGGAFVPLRSAHHWGMSRRTRRLRSPGRPPPRKSCTLIQRHGTRISTRPSTVVSTGSGITPISTGNASSRGTAIGTTRLRHSASARSGRVRKKPLRPTSSGSRMPTSSRGRSSAQPPRPCRSTKSGWLARIPSRRGGRPPRPFRWPGRSHRRPGGTPQRHADRAWYDGNQEGEIHSRREDGHLAPCHEFCDNR